MQEKKYDAVVIGAGAAGMAAALRIHDAGYTVALVDREDHLGGILLQCIHNGFGLHLFGEELTGPEFAGRFADRVQNSGIDVFLNTTVLSLQAEKEKQTLLLCSAEHGVMQVNARAAILAMGCRERNRGNLGIPGTRPAGVMTAGLAQRLSNIEGYIPGKRVVVVGSGDIGLIMARRMAWTGAEVLAVVEILPHPSGVTRNIVQCLHDFDIPLYLSHIVSHIDGRDRVEGVEITPLENGAPNPEKAFHLDCDTILLSVGLIPENELSKDAGIRLNHDTGGPIVDSSLMTTAEGIFACGNVLHVHDLVDWVAEEAERCGDNAVAWLKGDTPRDAQGKAVPGANIKYVVPNRYRHGQPARFSLRSMIVSDRGELHVKHHGAVLKRLPLRHIKPAEMLHIDLKADELPPLSESGEPELIEIALETKTS